jgi:hypothetical protein
MIMILQLRSAPQAFPLVNLLAGHVSVRPRYSSNQKSSSIQRRTQIIVSDRSSFHGRIRTKFQMVLLSFIIVMWIWSLSFIRLESVSGLDSEVLKSQSNCGHFLSLHISFHLRDCQLKHADNAMTPPDADFCKDLLASSPAEIKGNGRICNGSLRSTCDGGSCGQIVHRLQAAQAKVRGRLQTK